MHLLVHTTQVQVIQRERGPTPPPPFAPVRIDPAAPSPERQPSERGASRRDRDGQRRRQRLAVGGPAAGVCVTGATGYVGSWLVRTLLRRGRRVHATARDPAKAWRMLSAVEGKERLRVFRADMAEEGSFDDALTGCAALFHVAASMDLHLSPDHHDAEESVRSQVLEPATRGTINVLRSCVRAGTVRRVVFTSSVSTLAAAGAEAAVVDESCLRDLGDVWATKPIGWVYILSKRLAEEAAFGFPRENGLRLVSIVLPTVAGPFLTPAVPTSVQLLLSPVTRTYRDGEVLRDAVAQCVDHGFLRLTSGVSACLGS